MPSSARLPTAGFGDAYTASSPSALRRRASILDANNDSPADEAKGATRRSSLAPSTTTLSARRRSVVTPGPPPFLAGVTSVRRDSLIRPSTFAPTLSTSSDNGDIFPSPPPSPEMSSSDPLLKLTTSDIRRPSFLHTTAANLLPAKSFSLVRTSLPRLAFAAFSAILLLLLTSTFSSASLPFFTSPFSRPSPSPRIKPSTELLHQHVVPPPEDFQLKRTFDLVPRHHDISAKERLALQNGGENRKRLEQVARRTSHDQLFLTAEDVEEVKKIRAELFWGKSDVELDTVVIDRNASCPQDSVIIFIHGLAQHVPDDAFVPNALWHKFPSTRWVSPQAPNRDVSLFSLGTDFTIWTSGWFNMGTKPYDTNADHDDEAFFSSTRALNALIARERSLLIQRRRLAAGTGGTEDLSAEEATLYGTDEEKRWASRRIILSGFSEGGAMSLLTGLTHEYELGGLALFSTVLPLREYISKLTYDLNRTSLPIYWAHGTSDPWLAYTDALTCLSLLSPAALPALDSSSARPSDLYLTHPAYQLGMKNVEFSPQPGLTHAATDGELKEVEQWLRRVMAESE